MERMLFCRYRLARPLLRMVALETVGSFGLSGCDYWPPALQGEIEDLRAALNQTMDDRLRLSQELIELKQSQEAMRTEVEEKVRANRELQQRVAQLTAALESRPTATVVLAAPIGGRTAGPVRGDSARARLPAVRRGKDGGRPTLGVSEVQRLLRRHDLPIRVDGVYGPNTREAIRWFQRTKGLNPDGGSDRPPMPSSGRGRPSRGALVCFFV